MNSEPVPFPVGARDTRPCDNCGTPTTKRLSQHRSSMWTCSRACKATIDTRRRIARGTWQRPSKPRKGHDRKCEICGELFYARAASNAKFCSDKCRSSSFRKPRITKSCGNCGKEMKLRPSEAASGRRFCSKGCEMRNKIARPLERSHNGKPARLDSHGYVLLWEPTHPAAMHGSVFEHRLVMEKQLNRMLARSEEVHHINGNKSDNRPCNLEVLDGLTHKRVTAAQVKTRRSSMEAELEEYRKQYGPLKKELTQHVEIA